MTREELNTIIDTAITNKTEPDSITTGAEIGNPIKSVADYVDQQVRFDSYFAVLNQTGTAAPIATGVLNGLAVTPAFGYATVGKFAISISGLDVEKTNIILSPKTSAAKQLLWGYSITGTTVTVFTYNLVNAALENDMLVNTPIEVRIYR